MNGSFMQIINGQNNTYYDIFHSRLLIREMWAVLKNAAVLLINVYR